MLPSNFVRLSGLAAILAGAAAVIAELVDLLNFFTSSQADPTLATSGSYFFEGVVGLVGTMLVLVALVGLYAHQAEAAGNLGVIGFPVALLGTALVVGGEWFGVFVRPSLVQEAPGLFESAPPLVVIVGETLSMVLFVVGWLLFGIATLRARVYPRMATILLMIGAVLSVIPFPLTTVVFGVAVAWLGFVLLTERSTPAERQQPPRVR